MPRALVRRVVLSRMHGGGISLDGEPSIGVGRFDGGLVVNPIALAAGEERAVADSLRRLLAGRG